MRILGPRGAQWLSYFSILIFVISSVLLDGAKGSARDWKIAKGKHFIIRYLSTDDANFAHQVLRESERYYNKIANQIGYARYRNFWTWDDRVQVIIYSNKSEFIEDTGFPEWSRGVAIRDLDLFRNRIIVTYRQENDFLDGVLPHEISHLILQDFIGLDKSIPQWFDEGLAQLQEKKKKDIARKIMPGLIRQGKYLPIRELLSYNVKTETDPLKVSIFYVQSTSVIDFMLRKYGSKKFEQLCSNLKNGDSFSEAIRKSYISIFDSPKELEEKWISSINIR